MSFSWGGVRVLSCSACPAGRKSNYDVIAFQEHYARRHMDNFHVYQCKVCRTVCATAHGMLYHCHKTCTAEAAVKKHNIAKGPPFRLVSADLSKMNQLQVALEEAIKGAVEKNGKSNQAEADLEAMGVSPTTPVEPESCDVIITDIIPPSINTSRERDTPPEGLGATSHSDGSPNMRFAKTCGAEPAASKDSLEEFYKSAERERAKRSIPDEFDQILAASGFFDNPPQSCANEVNYSSGFAPPFDSQPAVVDQNSYSTQLPTVTEADDYLSLARLNAPPPPPIMMSSSMPPPGYAPVPSSYMHAAPTTMSSGFDMSMPPPVNVAASSFDMSAATTSTALDMSVPPPGNVPAPLCDMHAAPTTILPGFDMSMPPPINVPASSFDMSAATTSTALDMSVPPPGNVPAPSSHMHAAPSTILPGFDMSMPPPINVPASSFDMSVPPPTNMLTVSTDFAHPDNMSSALPTLLAALNMPVPTSGSIFPPPAFNTTVPSVALSPAADTYATPTTQPPSGNMLATSTAVSSVITGDQETTTASGSSAPAVHVSRPPKCSLGSLLFDDVSSSSSDEDDDPPRRNYGRGRPHNNNKRKRSGQARRRSRSRSRPRSERHDHKESWRSDRQHQTSDDSRKSAGKGRMEHGSINALRNWRLPVSSREIEDGEVL